MNHPLIISALLMLCLAAPHAIGQPETRQDDAIRVATFNVSLNRPKQGQLATDLAANDMQAVQVATILRVVRPDIVLLNEFDYDSEGKSIQLFRRKFLEAVAVAPETEPLELPFEFSAEVNTGIPSSMDLDKDGQTNGPADAFGFGRFPGQYGMVILSKYPIDTDAVRTFQKLLWKNLPNASAPTEPDTGKPWYGPEEWSKLRLSSKSHWDVPVKVGNRTLHILASHPTPPAFDGPEDRNGRRNHDEISLLRHIISGETQQPWLVDDNGKQGGLPGSAAFVICGDLNADPIDGGSFNNPTRLLLNHPLVQNLSPASAGAVEASATQRHLNTQHKGDPAHDTADFPDKIVGNLRVDYCLPSTSLQVVKTGVFWPKESEPYSDSVKCSDHRLVWVDIRFPE